MVALRVMRLPLPLGHGILCKICSHLNAAQGRKAIELWQIEHWRYQNGVPYPFSKITPSILCAERDQETHFVEKSSF